jgi:hypothetical protein
MVCSPVNVESGTGGSGLIHCTPGMSAKRHGVAGSVVKREVSHVSDGIHFTADNGHFQKKKALESICCGFNQR